MSTVRLVAIKDHRYAHRAIHVGEPYEAENPRHAAALTVAGLARPADGEIIRPSIKRKRKYKRRDMRAEG